MSIGKNSINRVFVATGGTKAEPEAVAEVKAETASEEKAVKKAPEAKKTESAKKTPAKKAPAKKAPAKKAPAKKKADVVKEVITEVRAETNFSPKKPASKKSPKKEEKKAYVNIGDKMPEYLL